MRTRIPGVTTPSRRTFSIPWVLCVAGSKRWRHEFWDVEIFVDSARRGIDLGSFVICVRDWEISNHYSRFFYVPAVPWVRRLACEPDYDISGDFKKFKEHTCNSSRLLPGLRASDSRFQMASSESRGFSLTSLWNCFAACAMIVGIQLPQSSKYSHHHLKNAVNAIVETQLPQSSKYSHPTHWNTVTTLVQTYYTVTIIVKTHDSYRNTETTIVKT